MSLVRQGAGPAEVRNAGSPRRIGGDSIAIMDPLQGRVVIFDGKLNHVATEQMRSYRGPLQEVGLPTTVISTRDAVGQLMRMELRPSTRGTGPERRPIMLGRLPFDGSRFDTIAASRGAEMYLTGGGRGFAVPMGAVPVFAVGQGSVYLGDSDRPAVGVWGFDGHMVRSIRWSTVSDPITPTDRASAFAMESVAIAAGPEIKRAGQAFVRSMFAELRGVPFPAEAPHFTRLFPTGDGGVWIERRPRPWLEPTDVLVADSTGAIIARVDLPSRFTPFQIGPDWVLGRWRNPDDVSVVRQYRMAR